MNSTNTKQTVINKSDKKTKTEVVMAVEKIDDDRFKSQANQLLDSFKYDLERPRYVDVLYFAQQLGFDVRIGMMKNHAE